jgi:hypothetical protein
VLLRAERTILARNRPIERQTEESEFIQGRSWIGNPASYICPAASPGSGLDIQAAIGQNEPDGSLGSFLASRIPSIFLLDSGTIGVYNTLASIR